MDFKKIFKDMNIRGNRMFFKVFQTLKPMIIENIQMVLNNRRKYQTGRPIKIDLSKFLDAVYFLCESGSQFGCVKEFFGIPKTTFYRYFRLLIDYRILQNIYYILIGHLDSPSLLITDTFIVKSMRGSVGLGRNPTDRGRKGLKVSLICDENRITRAVHIGASNTHDSKMLLPTIQSLSPIEDQVKCLCDSAYIGRQLASDCLKKNINLIVKPKMIGKSRKISHRLTSEDDQLLKKFRNRIELLNGQIRRFRSLMIKWVRDIRSYECFLFVALLSIAFYQFPL